tara:strand:+ start:563 stop:1015 length:453 start_codon:yes stop_codon:yes gene_type:complete
MNKILLIIVLLLFGCESNPLEPQIFEEYNFEIDTRLALDENGYYHMSMSEYSGNSEQSLVRFTAMTNNPYTPQFVWWDSDGYWSYDYMNQEYQVPVINNSSYTDDDGEAHTMFGPHISMVGDTILVTCGYTDEWNGEKNYYRYFYVVLGE